MASGKENPGSWQPASFLPKDFLSLLGAASPQTAAVTGVALVGVHTGDTLTLA